MAGLEKNLSEVKTYLDRDEIIHAAVQGSYETKRMGQDSIRNGIILATSSRIVFFGKKLGGYEMEVFPYSTISSLETSKGFSGYSIHFFASGNKCCMKFIHDQEGLRQIIDYAKQRIGHKENVTMPQVTTVHATSSVFDDLERLASLRDRGIITPAEFDSKKQELLSKIK